MLKELLRITQTTKLKGPWQHALLLSAPKERRMANLCLQKRQKDFEEMTPLGICQNQLVLSMLKCFNKVHKEMASMYIPYPDAERLTQNNHLTWKSIEEWIVNEPTYYILVLIYLFIQVKDWSDYRVSKYLRLQIIY